MAVAGAVLAVCAWLVISAQGSAHRQLARLTSRAAGDRSRPEARSLPPLLRVAVCLLAGVCAWTLLGGPLGIVSGVLICVLLPRYLSSLEPKAARVRRQSLEASAPLVADLLAACLASGSTPQRAIDAVASAIGGPTGTVLADCVAQLELGADASAAWQPLLAEPALAPIARAVSRSTVSGSPLADVLRVVADELRGKRKAEVDVAARTAGIKAVGPLGACFLPAFMLLAIVPLVASLISEMLQ